MEDAKKILIDFLTNYGIRFIGALFILTAGVILARYLAKLLDEWLTKKGIEPPMRMLTCRALKVLIFGFTAVLAMDKFGVPILPMLTGIGVVGVGLGLAMQGVLSNVVAGLTIIFVKPFRVGEWVEMLGVYGKVQSIELFSTTLAHPDRSKVVIPNRKIVGEILHNYGQVRQLNLTIGVAYATDLDKALAAVRDVLAANKRVLNDPQPILGVSTLADSSITISVKPWVGVDDFGPAGAEVYKAMVERFREVDVQIPFPQREVRMLGGEPVVQAA